MLTRQTPDSSKFNRSAALPYQLRIDDFQIVMQDVYDFFHDVNAMLLDRGLLRLDDILRPQAMSGIISDMVTASMAQHSRSLVENRYHNGHPDLVVNGVYAQNSVRSGDEGVEIKSGLNSRGGVHGGAVDTHGARRQWMCVFIYTRDVTTEPAIERVPMKFTEVYIGHVEVSDFRFNRRGRLGTDTATLHKQGIQKLRENWVYLDT